MNKLKLIIVIAFSTIAASVWSQGDTMFIDNGDLYTAAGEKIILRGMNEMYVWSGDKTGAWSLGEIAKTGANCVRLVWTEEYGNKEQLAVLIDNCIANKMIAMPECHDGTGDWSKLDICINFWNNQFLLDAVQRNKRWTLLNIGNEIGDFSASETEFAAQYKRAIDSLRSWGYTVPIVIDANGWGQNVDILIATWEEILDHDPLRNVIFSTHSYWNSTANYNKVVEQATNNNMPIIIGEGPSITLPSNCSLLDFETGLQILGENNIGWLSWSWGLASNGDCQPNFDHTTDGRFGNWETEYAQSLVFGHEYSLMKTAERPASFYENDSVITSGICVAPYNPTMKIGDTLPFEVILAPANAVDKSYSIDIDQTSSVITFSQDSSSIYAVAEGTATITATHTGSGIRISTTIIVEQIPVTQIEAPEKRCIIFPNPLDTGNLHIRFSKPESGGITVSAANGQVLFTQSFNQQTELIIDNEELGNNKLSIIKIELPEETIKREVIINKK